MATVVELPFQQDGTIYRQTDWRQWQFQFFDDEEETQLTDFIGSTFNGELLDKKGGTKLFDLTFNTPAADGVIWPQLTDAQSATLTGRTSWYWVSVTDASGFIQAWFYGEVDVSANFEAGA